MLLFAGIQLDSEKADLNVALRRKPPDRRTQHIVKIGLALVVNGRLLTVRKRGGRHFILPGGQLESGETDIEALRREIREELACDIAAPTIEWLGDFDDWAADEPNATVTVRLYAGDIVGMPRASSEIVELLWFDPHEDDPEVLAPSIRNQILPFVVG